MLVSISLLVLFVGLEEGRLVFGYFVIGIRTLGLKQLVYWEKNDEIASICIDTFSRMRGGGGGSQIWRMDRKPGILCATSWSNIEINS
jgi:hypothetical protein